MFAFDAGVRQSDIEAAIHTKYPDYEELTPSLVFLKDGKIVFSEHEAWEVEHAVANQVTFDADSGGSWKHYSKEAVFTVKQISYEDSVLFDLSSPGK